MAAAGLALALLYAGGALAPRRSLLGDEPSYVTIAHSLAVDGDISMADDYRDQEYRRIPEKVLISNLPTIIGIGKNQENLSCNFDDLTTVPVVRRPGGLRCSSGEGWLRRSEPAKPNLFFGFFLFPDGTRRRVVGAGFR